MKVQLLSFMSVILLPVLSACSSSEDRDRKAFIEKCMYPNKAIKTAVYTEKSCTCYYDNRWCFKKYAETKQVEF